MNLLIIGLPGAGKGTQARKICEDYNFVHLSSGDIVRESVKEEGPSGKKAEEYLLAGELVPDDIIIKMVEKRIKQKQNKNLVFDGFPRTLNQAEALTRILKDIGQKINLSIYLKVTEEELIKRISGRVICEECGKVYNKETNPPRTAEICDECGGSLYQRRDDEKEVVKKRIKNSKKRAEKIINYYQEKDVLKTVESTDKDPDEVHRAVTEILDKYIQKK